MEFPIATFAEWELVSMRRMDDEFDTEIVLITPLQFSPDKFLDGENSEKISI